MGRFIVNRAVRYVGSGFFFRKVQSYIRRRISDFFYGEHSMPIGDDYRVHKATVYDDARSNQDFWLRENAALSQFCRKNKAEINFVLDAPSGSGRFFGLYKECETKVTAVDLSPDMHAVAKEKWSGDTENMRFITSGIESLEYEDQSFDLVVCFRFLPWVVSFRDAVAALNELHRLTKKYAALELCVGKHERGSGPKVYPDKTLWNRFNSEEISDFLSDIGFRIMEVVPIDDSDENPGLSVYFCTRI